MKSLARDIFRWQRWKAFLIRFAPFWVAWVLVVLLPPSREAARLHFLGSQIDHNLFGQPWSGGYADWFDPRPLAQQPRQDPALAYWVYSWRAAGNERIVDSRMDYTIAPMEITTETISTALDLAKHFPREAWLQAVPLRLFLSGAGTDVYRYMPSEAISVSASQRKKLLALARQGQQHEPQNAFWWVAEATLLNPGTSNLLHRAAQCPYYDDKSLEARRNLVHAEAKVRPLSWEEKKYLASDHSENPTLRSWGTNMTYRAVRLWRKHQRADALALRSDLVRVGHLMMSRKNPPGLARVGYQWQQFGIEGYPTTTTRNGYRYPWTMASNIRLSAARFSALAARVGRPDLARNIDACARAMQTMGPWLNEEQRHSYAGDFVLNGDNLVSVGSTMRMIGFASLFFLAYLAIWWMLANIFLWRAQGDPSTRRDRIWPVAGMASVCCNLILATVWYFSLDRGPYTPVRDAHDFTVASLDMFAFLVPPFWLALVCGVVTARRHREALKPRRRVDLELNLSPDLARLERNFWPALLWIGLVGFFLAWLVWVLAVWLRWGTIDLAPWLGIKNSRGAFTVNFDEPWLPMYAVIMLPILLVGWFWKWRYATPAHRPITQGGVRWWKETLGSTIVLVSWMYLGLALAAWPIYQRLDARVEQLLQNGELQFAPPPASTAFVPLAKPKAKPARRTRKSGHA